MVLSCPLPRGSMTDGKSGIAIHSSPLWIEAGSLLSSDHEDSAMKRIQGTNNGQLQDLQVLADEASGVS
jgi:hypothetical protein